MLRSLIAVVLGPLLICGVARAIEVRVTIRSVDVASRTLAIAAGRQVRTVKVAQDVRVLDREGKELPGGLSSRELKEGAEVMVTVEPENGEPVIHGIRLGQRNAARDEAVPMPRGDASRLVPLTRLGEGTYQGFPGGLYLHGRNEPPPDHEAAGLALAGQVQPLDAQGRSGPQGGIVLLSVGMSNTTQEFSTFKELADPSPQKNPRLVLVDGAQGGMTAAAIQNADDNGTGTHYWTTVDERLRAAGVTRAQVQVAWIKEADAGPNQGFPGYARKLQGELRRIVQLMRARFPNLKLAYLSSRIYGGYARTPLNPEPYAYESGFAVKWLIEQQLRGDPELNPNSARGPVEAPWLSWGPYLWSNERKQQVDGRLFYEESDFAEDGTHPSPSGRRKVAEQLWKFFSTDPTTKNWFLVGPLRHALLRRPRLIEDHRCEGRR